MSKYHKKHIENTDNNTEGQKALEFQVSGCIFSNGKEISMDEFDDKFIRWIESMGWSFVGYSGPLED